MKILLVNDDGASASQLLPLLQWCQKLGEVTCVVPKYEQSGKSQAIELKEPFQVLQRELVPGQTIYTVDATPANCVQYAVLGMGLKPDLVISGVNRGYNMGVDILYSGTVGCCFEAINVGVPNAIALSTSFQNYPHATEELDRVWEFFQTHKLLEKHHIYNVNIPPCPKGFKITRQGGPFYLEEFIPMENNMVQPKGIKVYESQNDMTLDSDAVHAGYITISPLTTLRVDMQMYEQLKDLTP